MSRGLTQYVCLNGLALALLSGGAVPCQAVERQLVLLYNQAHAPEQTITEAEDWASRIMRDSGIELQWRSCLDAAGKAVANCEDFFGVESLIVQVAPSAVTCSGRHSLGWSSFSKHGATLRSIVCMDRVREFLTANAPPFGEGQMLGHVIAHEMGHLLLCMEGHAHSGIMSSPWGEREMRLAARGKLLFDYAQGKIMLDEVRRRAAPSSPATAVGAAAASIGSPPAARVREKL